MTNYAVIINSPPDVSVTVTQAPSASFSVTVEEVQPVVVAPPPLTVSLALPSGALTFSQDQATDLGDYVGPFVHQRCLMQTSGPWTVFFRPDADGSRQEVVVEYGTRNNFALPPTTADDSVPVNITVPYTATITQGGAIIATETVPHHYWGARWRWQSEPRPVKRAYADLLQIKAIPPLNIKGLLNPAPSTKGFAWAGPMDTAGLTTSMGATGDRPEIGLLTEPQAEFLMTGSAFAFETLMAQAEAMGTVPVWFRDASTNALLDVQAHPYIASSTDTFSAAHSHLIPRPPYPGASTPGFFTSDAAHFPPLSYVPWLMTDDPYFLEGLQAAAIVSITQSNYWPDIFKIPGMAVSGQMRGFAWGLRHVLQLAAMMPATVPSWLVPVGTWQKCAADNLAFVKLMMASTDPIISAFHFRFPQGVAQPLLTSAFETDYLMCVIGWAGYSGAFSDWAAAMAWLAAPRLAMLADPAAGLGWDRRWPTPYETGQNIPSPAPVSWAGLWSWYAGVNGLNSSGWLPNTLAPNVVSYGYCAEARGGLAALVAGGLATAQAPHDWLLGQIAPIAAGRPSGYKWAFWPS